MRHKLMANRRCKVIFAAGVVLLLGLSAGWLCVRFQLKPEFIKKQDSSVIEHSSQMPGKENPGRWIYCGSHTDPMLSAEDVSNLDDFIRKWMDGRGNDNELTEWMTQYVQKRGISIQTVGVMSRQQCLFSNEENIPNYETRLNESNGIYEFVGLYTMDEVDQDGKLICYYWEAGIR